MKRWCLILSVCCLAGCSRAPGDVAASGVPEERAPSKPAGRVSYAPDSPKLAEIRTAVVGTGAAPQDEVVAPGKVAINPNRIARVAPAVAGKVVSVQVRVGDAVVEGQPLASIESPDAEGALSDCLRSDAALTQARATLAKNRADLERLRTLYEHGAVAKKEVIDAEAELAHGEAGVKEAEAASRHSRRRLSILGLKPCEAGQHVVVRAPISGKVMDLSVVPGEYRNDTSAPFLTIADLSTVWVAAQVAESAIRWIHRGERVQIELAAYPGEVFQGRVMRISDMVDPQTRAVEVLTEMDNRSGRFRPEMFAKIRHSHGARTVPVVPMRALVRAEGSAWVYVERAKGEFERVRVETGEGMGALVPVLSGIEPGATVVVDGAMLLAANGGRA